MQRLEEWLTLEPKEVVMVWKQDLAKLKGAFPELKGPPAPPEKPKPKPTDIKDMKEEDAFFLAAMGAAPRSQPALPKRLTSPPPVPQDPGEATGEDWADLPGLKPLSAHPVLQTSVSPDSPSVGLGRIPAGIVADAPLAKVPTVEPDPEPGSPSEQGPIRMQLAAGMALEVDATLDLRHHSTEDALGRLQDRVEDGALMGWRTLHVILGEEEALHAVLLEALTSGRFPRISRYAQAPIPMGGAQAWILYL